MVTTPSPSDPGSRLLQTLPCPHCGEPVRVQFGLRRYPFRCTKCRQYSVFPLESRVQTVFIAVAVLLPSVLLIKLLGLDQVSTIPGIGALMAVYLGVVLVAARLSSRSSRKTATHLIKVRRRWWFW